jgi:hypothetical protein
MPPPPPDAWLAIDKLQHFLFCAAVAAAAYLGARASPTLAAHRLLLGAAAAFAAGAAKEAGDALGLWPGAASARDAAADAGGGAAGLAAVDAVDARRPAWLDRVLPRAASGRRGGGEEGEGAALR